MWNLARNSWPIWRDRQAASREREPAVGPTARLAIDSNRWMRSEPSEIIRRASFSSFDSFSRWKAALSSMPVDKAYQIDVIWFGSQRGPQIHKVFGIGQYCARLVEVFSLGRRGPSNHRSHAH